MCCYIHRYFTCYTYITWVIDKREVGSVLLQCVIIRVIRACLIGGARGGFIFPSTVQGALDATRARLTSPWPLQAWWLDVVAMYTNLWTGASQYNQDFVEARLCQGEDYGAVDRDFPV